jgi:copper chaperone CopZ
MDRDTKRISLHVIGVSCITCIKDIQRKLTKKEGIVNVKVNPIMNAFYIDYIPEKTSEEEIEKIVKNSGYKVTKLWGINQ